ncbi:MAG: HNH endonuclease [Ruminococcus sp.]|nr:HNH endonuclease [Ruminococcus sp.]
MSLYSDFYSRLLPGNYALTKSMELTKIHNSGTLWYTKKFLTLYYFIFLSNQIFTTQYQREVIQIFDSFIESLPENIQPSAREYFYPKSEAINFKSPKFNLFSQFAGVQVFRDQEERDAYYQDARKYYFSLLMGSGGQTGIKKLLKEAVQQPGFVYSHENIDKVLMRAAISTCADDLNTAGKICDNSVKYILSEEAIAAACRLAERGAVTEEDVARLNERYPHAKPKFRMIENDMAAFIRNERQILYYYGFFHSKSTGASDMEFSSLTPIGELALKAGYYGSLVIWEHQKLKMISQPATTEIKQIPAVDDPEKNFFVSFTPYTDILGAIIRQGSMTLDEYKYIVSRRKHCFDDDSWNAEERTLWQHLPQIMERVGSFRRKSDITDEDGRKELLKYLLGVRSDIPADKGTDPMGAVSFGSSCVRISDRDKLSFIYGVYTKLGKYKLMRYEDVLMDTEADLRRRYAQPVSGNTAPCDSKVKIGWDLYIIHPDTFLMVSAALVCAGAGCGITDLEDISPDRVTRLSRYIWEKMPELFRALGARTEAGVKKKVIAALTALAAENYSSYLLTDERRSVGRLAGYKAENSADLKNKIHQISGSAPSVTDGQRERSSALVNLMKAYYIQLFSENGLLKCECCGSTTFITASGDPYLEFHHLIPFNIADGPDHYLNLFAMCPSCHRKIHFMGAKDKAEEYQKLSSNNYLELPFVKRLKKLRSEGLLRSYQLDYLQADGAISESDYGEISWGRYNEERK